MLLLYKLIDFYLIRNKARINPIFNFNKFIVSKKNNTKKSYLSTKFALIKQRNSYCE